MKFSPLQLGTIALVVLLTVFGIGYCVGRNSSDTFYEEYKEAKENLDTTTENVIFLQAQLKKANDSLQSQHIKQNTQSEELKKSTQYVQSLRQENIKLHRYNDSLYTELQKSPEHDSTSDAGKFILSLRKEIKQHIEEIDSLKSIVSRAADLDIERQQSYIKLKNNFDILSDSVTSLTQKVGALPAPRKEKRLFGLFKLSPTESFLAGAVITTAAHVLKPEKLLVK